MHSTTILPTIMALAAPAIAAPAPQVNPSGPPGVNTLPKFTLHAYNEDISDWAVVNAHIAAGTNVIEVQRPTVYQSDLAYLNGTASELENDSAAVAFDLKGSEFPYELVIRDTPLGGLTQVVTQPGAGQHEFYIDDKTFNLARQGSGYDNFYVCPTKVPGDGEVFTVWFGIDAKPENYPDEGCKKVQLRASYLP